MNYTEALRQNPIYVPLAALHFAHEIAYPDLEVDAYLDRLAALAAEARAGIAPQARVREQALALAGFLFRQVGLQGNRGDYNDARNSYLNEVLDRRLGLPISLSVIYVDLARRLELPAYGVGLPGHFIVGVGSGPGAFYLDPFNNGQLLSLEDCAALVAKATGYDGEFDMGWLEPASPLDIVTRMLNNLLVVYIRGKDWPHALAVMERLRLARPDVVDYLRELGSLYERTGQLRLAVQHYEAYLQRLPEAPDAAQVRSALQAAAAKLAKLN